VLRVQTSTKLSDVKYIKQNGDRSLVDGFTSEEIEDAIAKKIDPGGTATPSTSSIFSGKRSFAFKNDVSVKGSAAPIHLAALLFISACF